MGRDVTKTEQAAITGAEGRDLYLNLLQRSLTHTLYGGADAVSFPSRNPILRKAMQMLRRRGMIPVRIFDDQDEVREEGKDWPLFAQTMVGMKRLDNLRHCVETVIADDIPGDLIETGVWRGGSSIFMRGVLRAHGVTDRKVVACDSFEGLPRPDAALYPADAGAHWHIGDHLAVSLDEVQDNFRRYDLLDDQVEFLKGWFRDTLPGVRDRTWAIARLDGDMYESTMDALNNLYDGLSPGGFLIVDDYAIEACRQAVDDFRGARGIEEQIEKIDWTGVYWRRSR
jgi:O-methyltransferase